MSRVTHSEPGVKLHRISGAMFLKILLIFILNFIHKNTNVLQTSVHQSWQLGSFQ